MSKKKDLFRKKLELFSQLSVDNVVNISDNGNYYVNLDNSTGTKNIVKIKYDFTNITKNTIDKIFTEKELLIPNHSNKLILTKTGKLTLMHRWGGNKYKSNFVFVNLSVNNYYKNLSYFGGDYTTTIIKREKIFKDLIFLNKKCEWLKDKSYFSRNTSLLKQYSSLSEMKKHLGYSFLSDSRFEGLFSSYEEKDNIKSYHFYNEIILSLIVLGKLTTLECRKFLIINILESLTEQFPNKYLSSLIEIVKNNFEDFKKGLVIQNTYYKTINYDTSTTSTQDEQEGLPF